MTIDEIVKYVVTTPENSNPIVLRSMLEQLNVSNASASGGDQYCTVLELTENDFTIIDNPYEFPGGGTEV